ncbi:acyltransferase 3 [Rhodomicrobium vannielii ATCC 17100]|uniref:Acyltransferase 3 n=1 Tax=Rhodomicrobium vannielii (strain ATCC 17100 / DSM 162 / LMG 4299 / NCIMB 10020 / ATH 3.1.1) TaxID=648757 RepID=E3I881_RHOVT|nr:acyltransferase family protein [Rhodomicrobium vannielii]ADP69706.1 acyltransferase 3 [Rhodomicrobium vannielii ATCC 17100]
MKYRTEIDGLRAVALLPVILSHAGIAGFSGGFVGVDIFFVISGYLITAILLADLAAGRFSMAKFYERRARRILPALSVVMLVCVPFAWAWMLPEELVAFGKSLIATALFGSNILFWRETDYFSAAAELKPLLHTWSLAIEEQYYLIFPGMLALLWRWRRALLLPALLVVSMTSLIVAEWGSDHAPTANFYLMPSRVWELLIGAIVAQYHSRGGTTERRNLAELAGFVGLALIAYSVVSFDAMTPMPSLWTLIPVVGAALALGFARQGTLAARLLCWRPLVAIGLISYSAYLWHQPLLAFARIGNISPPEGLLLAVLLLATFILAWLSWRFVEQPFRRAVPYSPGGRRVVLAALTCIGTACLVGAVLVDGSGFSGRKSPGGQTFASIDLDPLAPNFGLHPDCDAGRFTTAPACRLSDQPELALWGDSFAMHLAQALRDSPSARPFAQLTLSQCGPIPGLALNDTLTSWQSCIDFNDSALAWILAQKTVKTVVISSTFEQSVRNLFTRDGSFITETAARQAALAARIEALAAQLAVAGKQLVIVSPPPRTGHDLGLCHIRTRLMSRTTASCDFPQVDHYRFSTLPRDLLHSVEGAVPVIWLDDFLCSDGVCHTTVQDVPAYRDHGHLSAAGSSALGRLHDLAALVIEASHGQVRGPTDPVMAKAAFRAMPN